MRYLAFGVRGNGGAWAPGQSGSSECPVQTGQRRELAVAQGGLLAGMGPPWCGLEVGPWGEVSNQIRKVVEGMHWRMHDEPSFTIGSHRGKVPYRNHRQNKTTRISYCVWLYFFLFLVKFAKLTVCFSSRCTGIRSNLIESNVFD